MGGVETIFITKILTPYKSNKIFFKFFFKEMNYSGFDLDMMDMNDFPKHEVKIENYYNDNDNDSGISHLQNMAQTYNLPSNPVPLQQRQQNWVKQEPGTGNLTLDFENDTKQKLKIEGSGVQK